MIEKKLNVSQDYLHTSGNILRGFDDDGTLYLRLNQVMVICVTNPDDMAVRGALIPALLAYVRQAGGAYEVMGCDGDSVIYICRTALERYLNTLDPASRPADLLLRAIVVFSSVQAVPDSECLETRMTYYAPDFARGRDTQTKSEAQSDFKFGVGTYPAGGNDFVFGQGVCPERDFEDGQDCDGVDCEDGRVIVVPPIAAALACAGLALGGAIVGRILPRRKL